MQILTSGNTNPAQIQQLQSLLQQSAAHRSQSRSSRKEGSSSKKEKKEDSNSKSSAPATTPTPKPEPTTPAAAGVKLEDLQNILSGLPAMQGSSGGTPAKPIDLAEAMKADDIIPLLANESIRFH